MLHSCHARMQKCRRTATRLSALFAFWASPHRGTADPLRTPSASQMMGTPKNGKASPGRIPLLRVSVSALHGNVNSSQSLVASQDGGRRLSKSLPARHEARAGFSKLSQLRCWDCMKKIESLSSVPPLRLDLHALLRVKVIMHASYAFVLILTSLSRKL